MSEARFTKIRFTIFLVGLAMIITGLTISIYPAVNIQNWIGALSDSNLSQEERWSIEGSLKWWQETSSGFYYPLGAVLIVTEITAIVYVILVR